MARGNPVRLAIYPRDCHGTFVPRNDADFEKLLKTGEAGRKYTRPAYSSRFAYERFTRRDGYPTNPTLRRTEPCGPLHGDEPEPCGRWK